MSEQKPGQKKGLAVANPSFEADRFANVPGQAATNDGVITGWTFKGNVGLNPWWVNPGKPAGPQHSFSDNGVIPHGRQVALMQNLCTLAQQVPGFEAGKRYRVTYWENGRAYNRSGTLPRLTVTLGGETIVSPHAIQSVEPQDHHTLPYNFVESALFTAPSDGAYELVFRTLVDGGVTVLLDNVAIAPVE